MLLKRQIQVRFSIESAIIDPWQTCQGSKNSSEWSISIIVHSIHLGSQLRLEMVTLGNCLLRNVRSLILRCLDLKGVKQKICCWPKSLPQSFASCLLYFFFGVHITSDWLRNPPHVGSFWSLETFFCVSISVYFETNAFDSQFLCLVNLSLAAILQEII